MKLLRYGPAGEEKPGILDEMQNIRCLAGIISDISCETITPEVLARVAQVDLHDLPLVSQDVRIGQPIANPRQFICMGRNYLAHVAESKVELLDEPMVFSKALTSISGPNDDIPLYSGSTRLDYEGELALVIGRRAHRIREGEALGYVAGYCICNDVSERDWQFHRGGTVMKGKSAPGYGPLGPWLVTADEIPDPQRLQICTTVNGHTRQNASTSTMIFSVARFIAHVSEFMVLLPGDVLTTGTPEGCALGMNETGWLRHGDRVSVTITGLGSQQSRIMAVDA